MKTIKLTKGEISYLLHVLDLNEREGSYYGNKEHYIRRHNSLIIKLKKLE